MSISLRKKWIAALGFLAFFLHALICLLFSYPELELPAFGRKVVFSYIFPLFNHNNRLFAPDPVNYHSSLEMRYITDGSAFSPWRNPYLELRQKHQNWPVSPDYTSFRLMNYHLQRLYETWQYADYLARKKLDFRSGEMKVSLVRDSLLREEQYLKNFVKQMLSQTGITLPSGTSVELSLNRFYVPDFKSFSGGKRSICKISFRFPILNL